VCLNRLEIKSNRLISSVNVVHGLAEQMINHRLVTKQTKADGVLVQKVNPTPFSRRSINNTF